MAVLATFLLAGCATTDPLEEAKRQQVADTNTQLAVQYLQRGQLAIAIGRLERALEVVPEHSQANNMMGLIQWRLGKTEDAERSFQRAVDANPGNSEAHNNFGVFLCSQDRIDEAVRHFNQALVNPLYTTRAEAEVNAGRCLLKRGEAAGADKHFRNALAINSAQRDALYELAKLSFTTGQTRSAQGFLQRFFQAGPGTADALLLAVRVEMVLGNRDAQKRYAARLRSEFPDSPQARALASMGSAK